MVVKSEISESTGSHSVPLRLSQSVYRSDIDGLRALAVIAVLFSHLKLPYFDGGYIGVDIFFVISGYVIYGDLLKRSAEQNFSIREFWLRRARRLFPQLIVMVGVVLAVGSYLLLPTDFERLPLRALASASATSNWVFALQSGYFMPSSAWNPLLHTWTLSVEIQFYLVFPLILLALVRWRKRGLAIGLSAVCIVSILYCMWPRGTNAPFYDSLARAWEFILGALLHHTGRPKFPRYINSILSALAISAIGICIVVLGRDSLFPDLRALVPTLSTALLILSVRDSAFAKVFESKLAVRTGQMSYSIYMWHWPITVFSAYIWPDAVGLEWRALVVLFAILIVSYVMWQWVEEPLRRRSTAITYLMLAIGFVVIYSLCVIAWKSDGWRSRFDAKIVQFDNYNNDINPRREECHSAKFKFAQVTNPCIYGAAVAPEFAFWSDSHGVELIGVVTPWLGAYGKSAAQFSFSSCAPQDPPALLNDCDKFNRAALTKILTTPSIKTVVLAGATDDERYRNNYAWMKNFRSAAHKLSAAGKRLIIVYPVPLQRFPAPRALANYYRFSTKYVQYQARTSDYMLRTQSIFDMYDSIGTMNIQRVYPHRHLCDAEICATSDGTRPYYFDDNHLSLYGAKRLVPALTLAMDSK